MNSIINSGLSGLLHSQQSMQQSAHNITNINVADTHVASTQAKPLNLESVAAKNNHVDVAENNTTNVPSDPSLAPDVGQSQPVEGLVKTQNSLDPARDLINIQLQKQLFTASASVVEVGAEAVGSLIDDYS